MENHKKASICVIQIQNESTQNNSNDISQKSDREKSASNQIEERLTNKNKYVSPTQIKSVEYIDLIYLNKANHNIQTDKLTLVCRSSNSSTSLNRVYKECTET
jgi:hypothetical protein